MMTRQFVAAVEVIAEEIYLAIMQATQDEWLTWQHVDEATKSGYRDLGCDVADKIQAAIKAVNA